ncbi:leucyl/phenylalanyl-tRNA--protein transferase [Alcanivorax borkumensis]|jgi:leucyl/phenylalanyl-tRNA--protein transferase|uniref:leucyl/phenylalanyl-tRNA--protein transferase n=1 Tax=Alcanivorax borkumensis TaxID=59754 RepID=UPI003569A9E6
MVPWLEPGEPFPDTRLALTDPDGLLAAGSDLSPDTLLRAYSTGIFPWYDAESQPILWWSPAPRCVIQLEQLHVSRSLARHLRRADFTVTFDRAFETVMRTCAAPRQDEAGTWISEDMLAAYCRLHELGYAHSVEIWQNGALAGCLYGIQLGQMFFGESMASPQRNGSKVALVALRNFARKMDIQLLDAQIENPHLMSMGAEMMPRSAFEAHLQRWIPSQPAPSHWPGDRFDWPDLQAAHQAF